MDKKLVADAEKAPIIKYAFEQYSKGVSKKQIIDELNARGARNSAGNPLTLSSLQGALRSPKYIGKHYYNGVEIPDCCEALISEDVFYSVQARLDAVKHAPAVQKARQNYILGGKAFCGYCGTRLVGEAGKSKQGVFHHYYACAQRKKHHTCKKKNEKKDFLEWYVVEQTIDYVLNPARIEYIAGRVVEKYKDEFNDTRVKDLERQGRKLDKEINAAVDASLAAPAKVRQKYFEKIEILETQKADIEFNLSSLRIAAGHRYTEADIIDWLKEFCDGEPLDEAFQQRIIDVLVNSVFVFDDKIVIYYNIKDCKQVSYMEMCDSLEDAESSDDCTGVRISNGLACQKTL